MEGITWPSEWPDGCPMDSATNNRADSADKPAPPPHEHAPGGSGLQERSVSLPPYSVQPPQAPEQSDALR